MCPPCGKGRCGFIEKKSKKQRKEAVVPRVFLNFCSSPKSCQSCPTLCDPIHGGPPGSHPWDFPGKHTGVGCHFLFQCRKVKSESEVAQSKSSIVFHSKLHHFLFSSATYEGSNFFTSLPILISHLKNFYYKTHPATAKSLQ